MGLDVLFDGWTPVLRAVVACAGAYAGVVLLVRISGKRTLAQLNAFDWIVTVAFGPILATTALSDEVALVEGLAAFATLAALQLLISFVSTRAPRAQRVLKNEPTLLVRDGRPLPEALRWERISEEEILQAVRGAGVATLDGVGALVLETNGRLRCSGMRRAGPEARSGAFRNRTTTRAGRGASTPPVAGRARCRAGPMAAHAPLADPLSRVCAGDC